MKVDKATGDSCWNWKAAKGHDGYGRFKINHKLTYAHRVAWELIYGPIPEGLDCCHHCDNPACVCPNHLFLGTQSENALDSIIKKRFAMGENHYRTTLHTTQVREIRNSNLSQHKLACQYHVSRWIIRDILRGKTWKGV